MQHQHDGTHVILPATMHLRMPTDRAGLPVMWLRHTDGKMRRDGVRAALLQRNCAVAERGRLHGASGLASLAAHRVMAWIREACRKRERKREWLRSDRRHDRLRRQDKSRKVRPVGCERKCMDFNDRLNIVATRSKVQLSPRRCSYTAFDALRRPE